MFEWDRSRIAHSYVLPDQALSEVHLPSAAELSQSPAFHFQRGNQLYAHGEVAQSIEAYRRCVKLQAEYPNARFNLAVALGDAGDYAEADRMLKQVIEAEPERAEAYNSLGFVEMRQCRTDEAIANSSVRSRSSQTSPMRTATWSWRYCKRATIGVALTNMNGVTPGRNHARFSDPIHNGRASRSKIKFCRSIASRAPGISSSSPVSCQGRLGAVRIIAACPRDLMPLIATIEGVAEVREPGATGVAEFDVYSPLLSLPRLFGTTLDTVPAHVPYLDIASMRRRNNPVPLPQSDSKSLKIGIVWAGSPSNSIDRLRSCALSEFLPILRMAGVEFYSLQKGERARRSKRAASRCLSV